MALFNSLLRLHMGPVPLEDFFTELVAYLFDTHKDVLYAWVEAFDLLETVQYAEAEVTNQVELPALDQHGTGSRPDMQIELKDGHQRDIVFVESKIGSSEGHKQLSRYAEHLAEMKDVRHKVMLYITRDFDPKEEDEVLKKVTGDSVRFKPMRWHAFYRGSLFQASFRMEGNN